MNILHVNKLYAPHIGGIETITRDVVVASSGTVLCCMEWGSSEEDVVDGVRVIRAASFGRLFSVPLSIDFFWQFAKLAKQADVIVYHHPFPLATLAHLLFARKKTVVVWYHSDIVRQKFLNKLFRPFLKASLARAARIVVASQGLLKHSPELSAHAQKIVVIPFSIDTEQYQHSPVLEAQVAEIQLRYGQKPIILAVGRLVYYKGFLLLPEALAGIPEAVCVLIGEGPLYAEIMQLAVQFGVAERFAILPPQADVRPYYMAATVFAFPSTLPSEAFGLVQLEALASGLPVVNTNLHSGVPEVSVHDVTGYTVESNDAHALTQALSAIIRSSELRARFSAAARARAHEVYSKQQFQKAIRHLFTSLF